MAKRRNEDDQKRGQRRRIWISTLILVIIAVGFYIGIYMRWSHHPPVTAESTAKAAAHMGRY